MEWKRVVMGARSARRGARLGPSGRHLRLIASVLLLAPAFAIGPAAQTSRPSISVAETIPVQAAAQTSLVIRIGPPSTLPRGSFVRLRGLPPLAALSDGHSIAPGSWAVPLSALPDLRIILPATAAGRSELSITVVGT